MENLTSQFVAASTPVPPGSPSVLERFLEMVERERESESENEDERERENKRENKRDTEREIYPFAPAPLNRRHGTTHFSIMDREGNVVSYTTTIEENLGSAVVVGERGFLLNNELTDFTATPRNEEGRLYANRPEGGKVC